MTQDDTRSLQQEALDEHHVRAAQHDPHAFAPLYETYFRSVYGYCVRRLGDPQLAADATSETFIKALHALPRYRARSFRGWLFTIARHVVIDMVRRQKPTSALDTVQELADSAPSPETVYLTRESEERVVRLLRRLPETQRQVIELRMAGLSGQEIADVLGCRVGAVRTAQYRAHQRLRQMLDDEPDQEPRHEDV